MLVCCGTDAVRSAMINCIRQRVGRICQRASPLAMLHAAGGDRFAPRLLRQVPER